MIVGPRHHGQKMGGDCEAATAGHTGSVTIIVTIYKDVKQASEGCFDPRQVVDLYEELSKFSV
jgi:hypothetical protein